MTPYSEIQRESKAFAMRMQAYAKNLESDSKRYGVTFPIHTAEQMMEEIHCFLKNIKM